MHENIRAEEAQREQNRRAMEARLAAVDAAERARPKALSVLAEGGRVALVSDAGTPLISDPGYRLVREAAAAGYAVHPIPGASALLAGLSVAGLPSDRILFAGFPPPRSAARRTCASSVAAAGR